jgi:magnesium-transporting ATPase (P-type)
VTADGVKQDADAAPAWSRRRARWPGQALRVLAMAMRKDENVIGQRGARHDLPGLVGMIDPPRPEAKELQSDICEAGHQGQS